MAARRRPSVVARGLVALSASLFALALTAAPASAQISTDLIEKSRAEFHRQATDADMKREGGTQPRDWDYALPDSVSTRPSRGFRNISDGVRDPPPVASPARLVARPPQAAVLPR